MTIIHFLPTITFDSSYLLKLFYWFGLISTTINRCKKTNCSINLHSLCILLIINNYFGGYLRDILILHIDPFLFSESAIPELAFVLTLGMLYSWISRHFNYHKSNRIIDYIINIFDSLSLSSFISIGIDKCSDLSGLDRLYAFLSGYLTACYGGLSTSIMCSEEIFTSSNIYYHIIVILACLFYTIYANVYLICLLICTGLILERIDYTALVSNSHKNCLFILSTKHLRESIIYEKNELFNKTKLSHDFIYILNFRKMFIILHKIRLC